MAANPQIEISSISCSRKQWKKLLNELGRRGGGSRESGAFLLASPGSRSVESIEYFDDLDAKCLWGGITLSRDGFAKLSEKCRERKLVVIADVHTHPTCSVTQSYVDATNPMVRICGHVAIIIPNFALGRIRPIDVGVHVYQGEHQWMSSFKNDAKCLIKLTIKR